jgi:hypothetical protein
MLYRDTKDQVMLEKARIGMNGWLTLLHIGL